MSSFSQAVTVRNLLGPVHGWEQINHCMEGSWGGRSRIRRTWGWNKASTLGHHKPFIWLAHIMSSLWNYRCGGWQEAHQSAASLSESHLFLFDQDGLSIGATLADRADHARLHLSFTALKFHLGSWLYHHPNWAEALLCWRGCPAPILPKPCSQLFFP